MSTVAHASDVAVEMPKAYRCRRCSAIAWLLTTDPLPDGWHATADQHDPHYTCSECARGAGLAVAPPRARIAVQRAVVVVSPGLAAAGDADGGESRTRWEDLHAQVMEWEALAQVAEVLGRSELAAARREIAAEYRRERDELGGRDG